MHGRRNKLNICLRTRRFQQLTVEAASATVCCHLCPDDSVSAQPVDTTSYTALLQTWTEAAVVLNISRETSNKAPLLPIPRTQVPSLSFKHTFYPHATFLISHKVFRLQTNRRRQEANKKTALTGSFFSNNKAYRVEKPSNLIVRVSRMQMEIVVLISGC